MTQTRFLSLPRQLWRLVCDGAGAGRCAILALVLAVCLSACGRPDTLVIVTVQGLEPSITELLITLTLDGVPARNAQPTPDDPDSASFSVYKDRQRFGIDVPSSTQTLGIDLRGLNTSRVVVKRGSAQLDLGQSKDLEVTLYTP